MPVGAALRQAHMVRFFFPSVDSFRTVTKGSVMLCPAKSRMVIRLMEYFAQNKFPVQISVRSYVYIPYPTVIVSHSMKNQSHT